MTKHEMGNGLNRRLKAFRQGLNGFFKRIWNRKAGKLLLCLSGALLIAAVVAGLIIYRDGNTAAQNAERLLAEYEQELTEQRTPIPATATTLLPAPAPTPWTYEGYEVIGKLTIEKIEQELPIIGETNRQALRVSCSYYQGALPGEKGNMVITGHDYANGSIFGHLNKLGDGDIVELSTPYSTYAYEVYATEVITPDDVEALDEYEGDTVLTLMTCTSHGNRRLLVRCRLCAA